MLEQLHTHPEIPEGSNMSREGALSLNIDPFEVEVSQLAHPLAGDGVALGVLVTESSQLTKAFEENPAYMLATEQGGTCPISDCGSMTDPNGDCSDDTGADSGC